MLTYESDGLARLKSTPGCVVLPNTRGRGPADRSTVSLTENPVRRHAAMERDSPAVHCRDRRRVDRAVAPEPHHRCHIPNQRITVEPGVINLDVTRCVAPHGYYYAPDPSSQLICSIGGNVAENSGGAHCLKYGFTVHHVLGVEAVLPDGEMVHLGGSALDAPVLDFLGALVRFEGHARGRHEGDAAILRVAETVKTILAAFDRPKPPARPYPRSSAPASYRPRSK